MERRSRRWRATVRPAARGRDRRRGADERRRCRNERSTSAPVVAVHGTIVGVLIATLGDLMLDVIVRLDEPLAPGDDVRAAHADRRGRAGGERRGVGGGRSARSALHRQARRRRDRRARRARARDARRRARRPGRRGIDRRRRLHRRRRRRPRDGVRPRRRPDASSRRARSGVARLRRPPHLRLRPAARADRTTALLAARLARDRGARVSVDVAAWTEIRTFGPVRFRELLDAVAPDVALRDRGGVGDPRRRLPRGPDRRDQARPARLHRRHRDARLDLAPVEADVVDTTGAGDALAAGFLVGGSLEEAARRGLEAAARCVATVGSLP